MGHLNKGFIGGLSKIKTLLPSVDEVHNNIARAGGEVIVDGGVEIFGLESGLDVLAHTIPVVGHGRAPRIRQGIY